MKLIQKIIKLVRGFLKAMNEDHVGAYAAQSAYFIMLSFIPFIILLLTLIQYTTLTRADIYGAAQVIFPDSMNGFVIDIINEVYSKTAVTVSLSAITAAWSAGKGFLALMRGMNSVYDVEELRNYIVLRFRSAIYTLIFVISIILSLVVLVFGNSIHQAAMVHMPFLAVITGMILRLKDVVSIAFLTLVFMLLYKFVPNRKAKLLSQAPGAVFSSVCWYLFSIGFSLYVTYTPGLSNMYGSLTTIILAMLWLYFCMYIILLGAEINSYFEEQFRMVSRYRSLLHEEKKNKTEK
ncbi:MAG: YihY/virulence factor BrkB family protein [Lachnospiraceae bacterium]|jgi:membrane protein|nr:YihY/virulence factor BrkB family protein [Lachnospiraceae bacterium]MCI9251297.1 YihY/virulence factor BrkB family protein [Lachnospiraceae bacterium]MCI9383821.1 YihY/virulence factor BrkB family protein [Lachnospiraceae bacterium]MCI9479668.1 YihY/virulence factor BrkB family protein [Lachnospiraceae bacterium]MCI9623211.1 YihY/virulence factor BrkB family protein [Lachnospiraceae bacterium]